MQRDVPPDDERDATTISASRAAIGRPVTGGARQTRKRRRPSQSLGDLLLSKELIDSKQLAAALQRQGAGGGQWLDEILIDMGALDELALAQLIAKQHGLNVVDPLVSDPPLEARSRLGPEVARRKRVLPVEIARGTVVVAIAGPPSPALKAALAGALNAPVRLVVAPAGELRRAIEDAYPAEHDVDEPDVDRHFSVDREVGFPLPAPPHNGVSGTPSDPGKNRNGSAHSSEERVRMDLASVWRVLVKHKVLTLTLVALTAVFTFGVVSIAGGNYTATRQEVLLEALVPTPIDGVPTPATNNPYLLFELPDVADVVQRAVMSPAVDKELRARGLSGTYDVEVNSDFQRGPVITMLVTADSQHDALVGLARLRSQLTSTLEDLQLDAGANPAYLVRSQAVTTPAVEAAGVVGKVRVAAIALGVGIVLTLVIVFGVESFGTRRRRNDVRRLPRSASVSSGFRGDRDGEAVSGDGPMEPAGQ